MNKKMKNLSKNIVAISMSLVIAIMTTNTVQATTILESANPSLIQSGTSGSNGASNKSTSIINNGNTIQGGGTLEKAEDYVDNKLGDVIGFFQSAIKPFTYVTFILSAIMLLLGVVTGSKNKFYGLLGMAFSVLVYVGLMYAPQIVDYFSNWLAV